MTEIEYLLTVGAQENVEHRVGYEMNGCARRGHSAEDAWLEGGRSAFLENGADQHLAQMSVLAFTYRIYAPTLPDKAPHSGIFVPDVAELHLGDLAKGVVRACVLQEPKQRKLADKLAGDGRA